MNDPYIIPARQFNSAKQLRQVLGTSTWTNTPICHDIDGDYMIAVRDKPATPDLKEVIKSAVEAWHGHGLSDEFAQHLSDSVLDEFEITGRRTYISTSELTGRETWGDIP